MIVRKEEPHFRPITVKIESIGEARAVRNALDYYLRHMNAIQHSMSEREKEDFQLIHKLKEDLV